MGKTVGEKPANETVVSKNKTEKTQAVLDALNKDHHEFKILKKWTGFTLQHNSLSEPISLHIATLEQAMEFRNFLETEYIKDKSCIDREDLSKCILVNPDNNAYSRLLGITKDAFRGGTGKVGQLIKTPDLFPEMIPPSFVKNRAQIAEVTKEYRNAVMTANTNQDKASPILASK